MVNVLSSVVNVMLSVVNVVSSVVTVVSSVVTVVSSVVTVVSMVTWMSVPRGRSSAPESPVNSYYCTNVPLGLFNDCKNLSVSSEDNSMLLLCFICVC